MIKKFAAMFIALFFVACADKHQLLKLGTTSVKLDSTKSIYISISKDGRYGNINYQGSGENTSQIILMSLSKYSDNIEIANSYQSLKDALNYSIKKDFKYLVFPTILEWEDRATEWSGISDKASIKIRIIEVKTEKTLDSVIIKGKSGWATFGGDHPQDLLPKPVEEYILGLF